MGAFILRSIFFMRKRSYKYIHALAAIALGLALASVRQFAGSPVKMAQADDLFYVARVVDGDTLKLSDGRKVRLIGIDTPELHYGSKLLKDAKKADEDILFLYSPLVKMRAGR